MNAEKFPESLIAPDEPLLETEREILLFEPVFMRTRWGGRKLFTMLDKTIGDEHDYAESWEISDHPSGVTVVRDGMHRGLSVGELFRKFRSELMGTHYEGKEFPLLIKFLDCNDLLSLQVHPDDDYAMKLNSPSFGKTEAWYVVHAEPGSYVYSGLKPEITREQLEYHLQHNTVEECLVRLEPQIGDCLLIPPGVVHALGKGLVIAETQQTSDLTYRLHDWGRVGSDGKPRELHIKDAFACIDFQAEQVKPAQPQIISHSDSHRHERLVQCEYFAVERLYLNKEFHLEQMDSCRMIVVVSGALILNGNTIMPLGTTGLIPACAKGMTLCSEEGETIALIVHAF